MRIRVNRFRHLFYNGDWHTQLIASLKLAKEETGSNEIQSAIQALEGLLANIDECIHTVTVVQDVPIAMELKFLMGHVQKAIDVEPASAQITPSGQIALTVTGRGSRQHVQCWASSMLRQGLSAANAEIWIENNFR